MKHKIFRHEILEWDDIGQKQRGEQELVESFKSQPWYDWLIENKISIRIDSAKDMASFSTIYVVTADFEPEQLTYFLLKWPKSVK